MPLTRGVASRSIRRLPRKGRAFPHIRRRSRYETILEEFHTMTGITMCGTIRRMTTAFLSIALATSLILQTQSSFTTTAASREPVRARHGIVASPNEIASKVGVDIMKRGGNAADAPIASAFALAVTHPAAGKLG